MTENDKAARVFGWGANGVRESVKSDDVGVGVWVDEHGRPAPDMSDPRNYMRALEGLRQRNVIWIIYANTYGNHGIEIRLKPPIKGYPNAHHTLVNHRSGGGDFAFALVKALATLYDAEHPETEVGR